MCLLEGTRMSEAKFEPLKGHIHRTGDEMVARSEAFFNAMKTRRTVRMFSPEPVPKAVIEHAILTAGRAPSGANKQPWHFAAISDPDMKARIRAAAEEEERAFYGGRAGDSWLKDLEPFGTDEHKPFLETAPWLIAVFRQSYGTRPDGARDTHYYVHESAGLAAGFLLAALHHAGLATLTHTPSPMGFLADICGRPASEKATMLVVAGYPAKDCEVPVIDKKPLSEISSWF